MRWSQHKVPSLAFAVGGFYSSRFRRGEIDVNSYSEKPCQTGAGGKAASFRQACPVWELLDIAGVTAAYFRARGEEPYFPRHPFDDHGCDT